jgi:hypothetical protein
MDSALSEAQHRFLRRCVVEEIAAPSGGEWHSARSLNHRGLVEHASSLPRGETIIFGAYYATDAGRRALEWDGPA